MVIGVLGGNGFLGSNIISYLNKYNYNVYSITRDNYESFKNFKFDVLINANGNSKKYLAELNPKWDFECSVNSVYNSIIDFKFDKYIYISSIDVVYDTIYGSNKLTSEFILKSYQCKFGYLLKILRCGSIIGEGMKKGIVYDILNNNKLYVTEDSDLYIISVKEICNYINTQIIQDDDSVVEYLVSSKTISVKQIGEILKKKLEFNDDLKQEIYSSYIVQSKFKLPEFYIKELINA